MQPSNTVRIVPHTFTAPNGDSKTVEVEKKATSRTRAEQYVKNKIAKWAQDDEGKAAYEAIYFLDPLEVQHRIEDRRAGNHGWYVGDCGGSKLLKSYTRDKYGRGGVSGGTRQLMTHGGQHSFMDAN